MSEFAPGDAASVQELFETIAPRYDQLNDSLSLGLHRLWKRQALAWVDPQPRQRLLDLCCGTGDLALLLAARVRPGGTVLGLDAAPAPLERAKRRAARQPWLPLQWEQADALATGLSDGWADGAVMAYGLRNLDDPAGGLVELRRLLRLGGRAAVLDFNRPPASTMAGFQQLYLRRIVVPAARAVGLEAHYAYLEASLARFPTGPEQERLAHRAGFDQVRHVPIAAGLMGMLQLVA
ncbi:MAG: bifunctional demethylmenaquinone methyltransferase/2-methoxy-6-polyprenyl-1,4-benzoquinol methylase UbiE [Cyanobacteria bacterium K_DeepCast_35m_m2_023]|nr:bifunctional demethylmenaquinone methyltransferase/2-methoxy-6-polyprenyl-1,4-benzoquinol methylase UbiE [Cyanobacteria bacterium K_DeepCast_35m_m2_023]